MDESTYLTTQAQGSPLAALHSPEEAAMFFKKPETVACAVCDKTIEPDERRFVDKNRITKVERHTHIECQKQSDGVRVRPS